MDTRLPSPDEDETCLELLAQFEHDFIDLKVLFFDEEKKAVGDPYIQKGCETDRDPMRRIRIPIPDTAVFYRITAIPRKRDDTRSCVGLFLIMYKTNEETNGCMTEDVCEGKFPHVYQDYLSHHA